MPNGCSALSADAEAGGSKYGRRAEALESADLRYDGGAVRPGHGSGASRTRNKTRNRKAGETMAKEYKDLVVGWTSAPPR